MCMNMVVSCMFICPRVELYSVQRCEDTVSVELRYIN